MSMMTQQILKSVNLTKTQKCRYLENKTIFFSKKKKKLLTAHQGLIYCKKNFVAEDTFSRRSQNQTKNKIVEEKSQVSP